MAFVGLFFLSRSSIFIPTSSFFFGAIAPFLHPVGDGMEAPSHSFCPLLFCFFILLTLLPYFWTGLLMGR